MPDIDWTIFNNIFTKNPSTSGVGNTTSTDTKPAGSNSSSSSSSGSESVSNSDISDAYGEALGILKDQGSIPENIPDTADNTKDAVTYFLYRLEAWIEANDEMVEYAEYIENQGRNYISNYLQTQKNPPFNVSAAFNEFLPVIKEQITEKQSISQSVKDKTTGLKENVEYNFELLMAAYAEAQGDNGYINSAEYAVVINMAVDYLMGVLLNGDYDNAFFAGIIPPKANGSGGYSINTDYKTAVSNIQKLANAQTPEDAQKYLNEVDAALRRFLGARNLGGSSKIGTAIENRQQQIFYEKCTKETGAVKDELCEAYADGSPKPEKEEVDKYVEFVNAIEAAFIAQYEGDGTNIKEEFSDYAQSVIKEHENVSAILKGLDVLEEKFGAYYNQLLEACKEDGELDNYLDETDRQEVIDQATGYVLSDIVRGNESGNMLVALGFSKDDRYKEVTSLLKGIENSVTPMDDYNKIRELITEMLTEAGANKIFALVEAQEELSNVDIDKNPALTDGLIENTIGEDIKVSLAYTIKGEKVVWADKEGKDDLNKVFTELEKRVQAAMKEHMGAAYDAKQVSEWFNYSIMAALNETSNVRTEVSISSFVQTVLAQFDSTSTMVLKGGDFESFAARELNMAKGIAESIAVEDTNQKNAEETAQNSIENVKKTINELPSSIDNINTQINSLRSAINNHANINSIDALVDAIKKAIEEAVSKAKDAKHTLLDINDMKKSYPSSTVLSELVEEVKELENEISKLQGQIPSVETVEELQQEAHDFEDGEVIRTQIRSSVENAAQSMIDNYKKTNPSEQELSDYIKRMENIKTAFIQSYNGDVSNVDKEFRVFAQNGAIDGYDNLRFSIIPEYDKYSMPQLETSLSRLLSDYKNDGFTDKERDDFIANTYLIVMKEFISGNTAITEKMLPGYKDNEFFKEADTLMKNISTSATPEDDWYRIEELIKEMIDNTGAEKIADNIIAAEKEEAKLIINLKGDTTVVAYLWGYNANDTAGGDDLVTGCFKIENGKVIWLDGDFNKTIIQLKDRIHRKLSAQLGDIYNKAQIDGFIEQAMQELALSQSNVNSAVKVSVLVDDLIKRFDEIATKGLKNVSVQTDETKLDRILLIEALGNRYTAGNVDGIKTSTKGRHEGHNASPIARDDIKNKARTELEALRTAILAQIKSKLGNNYDETAINKIINNAISNVVDGYPYSEIGGKGHYQYRYHVQTLFNNFFNTIDSMYMTFLQTMGLA